MTQNFPELVTTRQAAELLSLSPRTLEGLRLRGGGPSFLSLGSGPRARVRYSVPDLLRWMESGRRTSTSDAGRAA